MRRHPRGDTMAGWFDRFVGAPQPAATSLAWFEDTFRATLVGVIAGGSFQATFAARWLADPNAAGLNRDWMRQAAVRLAEGVTQNLSVTQLDTAQLYVNGQLRTLRVPAEANARDLAISVTLSATAEAQRTAAEWEKLQSQLALRRLNDHLELERLRHLREDIFARPEVARTYWLDKHPERLDGVLDDRFERIAEKLDGAPGPSTMVIANVLQDFLTDLPPEHKITLLDLLQQCLRAYRREELAEKLPPEIG
ncbi:hypothetical protein ACPCHT_06075 [Nucisporomicrobium flavum]|uniref:hypothetical protein n=1 Tax=Nucisporomicrobium flavum TaxID=2785915 RepID=UPI003C2BFF52